MYFLCLLENTVKTLSIGIDKLEQTLCTADHNFDQGLYCFPLIEQFSIIRLVQILVQVL